MEKTTEDSIKAIINFAIVGAKDVRKIELGKGNVIIAGGKTKSGLIGISFSDSEKTFSVGDIPPNSDYDESRLNTIILTDNPDSLDVLIAACLEGKRLLAKGEITDSQKLEADSESL